MSFNCVQVENNYYKSEEKNYRSSQHKLRPRKDKKHWESKKNRKVNRRKRRKRKTSTRG